MTNLTVEMIAELSKPFDSAAVQWKPGATSKDKTRALALAYATSRAYYDRLDAVVGTDWADDYEVSADGQRVRSLLRAQPLGEGFRKSIRQGLEHNGMIVIVFGFESLHMFIDADTGSDGKATNVILKA